MPETPRHRLLVVDDAPDTREVLHRNLTARGYDVITACDVAEALRVLSAAPVDLVITDLKMPGASGLALVRHVREHLTRAEVITITGYPSVEGAVSAVKSGAEEYLTKPFTQDELFTAVARAIEKLGSQAPRGRAAAAPARDRPQLIATSASMQRVLAAVAQAAASDAPVLVTGEHGAGKTTIARLVHEGGARAGRPFAIVPCDAGPGERLESQLLGEVVPGRTDPAAWRPGLLQTLSGGTVLLDDVSRLSPSVQRRLAEVLAGAPPATAERPGPSALRCRVLAASIEDLRELVALGVFREDLCQRLGASTIAVPALRERPEDIVPLAQQFLARHARPRGRTVPTISEHALGILQAYPWPGNLAELEICMRQLARSVRGETADVIDLPDTLRAWSRAAAGANRTLAEIEADHIRSVLASVGGHKTRAAEILGINRKTLREKLKDAGSDATSE